jgi:hypothetical protein
MRRKGLHLLIPTQGPSGMVRKMMDWIKITSTRVLPSVNPSQLSAGKYRNFSN